MSALVRWKDDGSDADSALRGVMRHAGQLGPSETQLAALTERVMARLPAAAPGVGQDASPSAATGPTAPALAKLIALGVGALLCGSALWLALRVSVALPAEREAPAHEAPAAGPPAANEALDERSSAAERPTSGAPPAPLADSTELDPSATVESTSTQRRATTAPPDADAVRRAPSRARAAPAVALGAEQAAGDELSLLHEARRLLRAEPAAALRLAREHERRYPDGAFREEREALIVEVLLRTGQRAEGEARLAKFAARYPNSPYAARLRSWQQQARPEATAR